jgi:hypothetical protein
MRGVEELTQGFSIRYMNIIDILNMIYNIYSISIESQLVIVHDLQSVAAKWIEVYMYGLILSDHTLLFWLLFGPLLSCIALSSVYNMSSRVVSDLQPRAEGE